MYTQISRKIFFFLFGIFFFVPYLPLFANIEISEIMYDLKTGSDDGREWVEVFNNSDTEADLSSFKFFEANTNHKLVLFQGEKNLGAHSYAIIVSDPMKFKTDWSNFSGIIFDSSFSLNNGGEILAIKNADLIVDEYAYNSSSGGAGNGKSLQKINGVWTGAMPTPGAENKIPPPPIPPTKPKNNPVSRTNLISETTTPPPAPLLNQGGDGGGNSVTSASKENSNRYFSVIILILLVGLGGGAIYFIRRKKISPKIGEDFEILDE